MGVVLFAEVLVPDGWQMRSLPFHVLRGFVIARLMSSIFCDGWSLMSETNMRYGIQSDACSMRDTAVACDWIGTSLSMLVPG
jgi:hypothetical protein